MESAYLLISATFGIAVALGALAKSSWVAIGVPTLIPFLLMADRFKGPGIGEALLFVSPFLVATAILYGGVSYVGAKMGRKLRAALWRAPQSRSNDEGAA